MNAETTATTLPFPRIELEGRIAAAREALTGQGLDAALVFAQETDYWLTGYDTGGFVFFQCLVVTLEGPLTLLTRRPDQVQARDTSIIDDVRIWWDADDADPARELRDILAEKGLRGRAVGIELGTHGLTGLNHQRVRDALDGFCTLVDVSWLLRRLRLSKSAGEMACVRRAAELCRASLEDVIAAARPGVMDTTLKSAFLKRVLEGGADMPPNPPLFNSGRRALYGRGVSGGRVLEARDQIIVEYPVSFRRYNVKTEWTIVLGALDPRQARMYEVARRALAEMTATARPGRRLGEIFEAHARILDEGGYARHRYGACGYSVGVSFPPTSMDVPPMIYPGAALECAPGMTLFYHVMITDTDTGLAMGVGHTLLVTGDAPEILNPLPDALTVKA
ncbi:MAG: Xaa-Pro peptidase family protein [Immundisolibacterales bacterium]|nr:Xaa-Pro peptidase family protein [Immundisolibacterales bacterium]